MTVYGVFFAFMTFWAIVALVFMAAMLIKPKETSSANPSHK